MAKNPRASTRHRTPRVGGHDPGRRARSIDAEYSRARRVWSDVQDHLPRFVAAVLDCDALRVIELGSRGGVSTRAWLYALSRTGGHLWTVDLDAAPRISTEEGVWTHVIGDDLSPEVLDVLPDEVDVLFIDTSHVLAQTLRELEVYSPRVRSGGVIFLHDTDLEYPDGCSRDEPFPVRTAIERFTVSHGLTWVEHPGSYGLGEIVV